MLKPGICARRQRSAEDEGEPERGGHRRGIVGTGERSRNAGGRTRPNRAQNITASDHGQRVCGEVRGAGCRQGARDLPTGGRSPEHVAQEEDRAGDADGVGTRA